MSESDTAGAAESGAHTADEIRSSSGSTTGLFKSLSRLLATLVTVVQTRVELFTTEIQEEVHRAASMALLALIALFTALIGLMLGGLTIVFAYWDTHRVLAAALVTAAFFVLAAIAVATLLFKAQSHRRFLDATLTELKKDTDALRSNHL